jgi:hypothetical protein
LQDEDDVMLAVPAAPRESLAQVVHYEAPHIRPHIPRFQSLGMRQTIVPILLTVGTILCIAGVVKLLVGEDSPLHEYGNWLAIVFFAAGGATLALGLLNMLQLRSIIRKRDEAAAG